MTRPPSDDAGQEALNACQRGQAVIVSRSEIGEVSAARHRLFGHGAHETQKVPRPMLQFGDLSLSQLI